MLAAIQKLYRIEARAKAEAMSVKARLELRQRDAKPIFLEVGQLIATIFPGSSRSGTTILLLLTSGLNRTAATEFSFLLGIPTMLAAGGLKIFKALRHAPGGQPEDWGMVALGFVVSALVSFGVVKWLIRYVQTHTFEIFGWYRIALAVILLALFR